LQMKNALATNATFKHAYNLTEAIQYKFDNLNLTMYTNLTLITSATMNNSSMINNTKLECKFFDPVSREWSNFGCKSNQTSSTSISCYCNHYAEVAVMAVSNTEFVQEEISENGKVKYGINPLVFIPIGIVLALGLFAICCLCLCCGTALGLFRKYKHKSGTPQEDTAYINVDVYDSHEQVRQDYLQKLRIATHMQNTGLVKKYLQDYETMVQNNVFLTEPDEVFLAKEMLEHCSGKK